jgi:hypothetical protein
MLHKISSSDASLFWGAAALVLALAASPACELLDNPTRAGQSGDASTTLVHSVSLNGHAHADGLCRPLDNCTACHGADLKGGKGGQPSCFSCHADLWSRPNCGQGTTSHTISIKGILHKPEYCQPLANCAACHGPDLSGGPGGVPGCTSCHGALWTSPNCGHTAHTVNLGGHLHAENYCNPLANCTGCHGADLSGGPNGAPSCTSCHGTRWTSPDCGKNTHTVNLGGHYHASEYCRPYQNCVSCHGANLRGGANGAPSCLTCHDQKKWMNCGTTQHNDRQDGYMHARNKRNAPTDCTPCHGADLRGGPNGEPSCYKCHGKEW